ncbi:MAG: zinc ribbon domain-containing protein [Alphaproteobacteria bacterium]|nr:zinc ribbon domain-containing protein [Alphaproteobacteria bacterium]
MTDALKNLTVPGPTMIALTEPFWQAVESGRLTVQKCNGCGHHIFYPRALCPHCWSNDLSWVEAAGTGTLKSFSQVHRPAHPGWVPAAGYIVGLVVLTEGPTMLSLILPHGDQAVNVGDAVRMHPTNVGGRMLPVFKTTPDMENLEDAP